MRVRASDKVMLQSELPLGLQTSSFLQTEGRISLLKAVSGNVRPGRGRAAGRHDWIDPAGP